MFVSIFLTLQLTVPARADTSRLQKILDAKEIRVCIWPDYYGITFRNPKTRMLSGIDIDLSAELAKDLGVRLKYIDSSFPQLIDNLLSDQCEEIDQNYLFDSYDTNSFVMWAFHTLVKYLLQPMFEQYY